MLLSDEERDVLGKLSEEIERSVEFVQRLAAECSKALTAELTKESQDLSRIGGERWCRLSFAEWQVRRVVPYRRRTAALAPEPAC